MTSITVLEWRLHRMPTRQLEAEYLLRRQLARSLGNRTCIKHITDELTRRRAS